LQTQVQVYSKVLKNSDTYCESKDCNLFERIKNREELAFRELVENYQTMVINTSYGLLQNYNEAEDISQDVFVEVYESIHKFSGDSKLSTWLYRIAINKSINACKKKQV